MANTMFHESYGEVTRKQLAAYRKHNISQSDHDDLVDMFGESNRDAIVNAIVRSVEKYGQFSSFRLRQDEADRF